MLVKKCIDFFLIVLHDGTQEQISSVNTIFASLVKSTEAGKLLNELAVRFSTSHGLFSEINMQCAVVRGQSNEAVFGLPLNNLVFVFDRPPLNHVRGFGYRDCPELLEDFQAIDFIVRDKSTIEISTSIIRQRSPTIERRCRIVQMTYRRMESTFLLKAFVSASRNDTPPLVEALPFEIIESLLFSAPVF